MSAFFSGSETGFYRITRVRLGIEALAGNWTSRGPVVARQSTDCICRHDLGRKQSGQLPRVAECGDWLTEALSRRVGSLVDILGPIVLAPVVFLLGELLPKNLFYDAPNRLLKRCTAPLLGCTVLFFPVTALLWAFSRAVQIVTNSSPQELRLRLARRELAELITEGHEAGILRPAQQTLAQAMLAVAALPLKTIVTAARSRSAGNDHHEQERRAADCPTASSGVATGGRPAEQAGAWWAICG